MIYVSCVQLRVFLVSPGYNANSPLWPKRFTLKGNDNFIDLCSVDILVWLYVLHLN